MGGKSAGVAVQEIVVGAVTHNALVQRVALEAPDCALLERQTDQEDRYEDFGTHQLQSERPFDLYEIPQGTTTFNAILLAVWPAGLSARVGTEI